MKIGTFLKFCFISLFYFVLLSNCKKDRIKAPPTVTLIPITEITAGTATSGGNITYDGGGVVLLRGVCYSTNQNPTISDFRTNDGTGTGTYKSLLGGLNPGMTYYIRAFASNQEETGYSAQATFSTPAVGANISTTYLAIIVPNSAIAGSTILSDGGSVVTARGVCWSVTQNPTLDNSKTTDGTGIGTFASNLTGLLPGTIYFVRAYATNSIGTSYGNQMSLMTNATIPVLTTTAATSITATTSVSGGNITSNGGLPVTSRGVCWSTQQNPTIANSKTTDGTAVGVFSSNISGLTHATTYYLRSYATNSLGTGYGSQVTFTTLAEAPVVTTAAITAILETSAVSGGNVTSDGGATVTARGVCWSTSSGPVITNSKTTDATGTGIFTSNMTGLISGTTYYVRAYATNSAGTSYGSERSFYTGVVDVDGNVYHTVTIGTQTWLLEDLKTTHYRNGDPITYESNNNAWQNLSTEAFCWYNNDAATYKSTYGALYNWWAASDPRNLAPVGWHVPTDAEWITLFGYLGGQVVAGGPMKESGASHWTAPNLGATNTSGFTALGAGVRYGGGGSFAEVNNSGYWWSTSVLGSGLQLVSSSASVIFMASWYPMDGFSVRCIKD